MAVPSKDNVPLIFNVLFKSVVPVIVIVSLVAFPNVVFPSTDKSPVIVKSLTSSIVTFLLPTTTSIEEPFGGAVLNVKVVPLTE